MRFPASPCNSSGGPVHCDALQATAVGHDALQVRTTKAHAQFVEVQEAHVTGGTDGSVLYEFGADFRELPVHLGKHHHAIELGYGAQGRYTATRRTRRPRFAAG